MPSSVPAPRTERSRVPQAWSFLASEEAWQGDESVLSKAKQGQHGPFSDEEWGAEGLTS